ncbi:MAG: potassium channel protein [Pirellulales bacterium]|nr:potassium channel protein [Pirellulales bacterium]
MKNPWRRLRNGAIALAVLLFFATVGYKLLRPDDSWLDCLYMVAITAGTVGYGEHSDAPDAEKLFTIVVILTSVTAVAYIFGSFVQIVTAGELQRALGHMRMTRELQKLNGHVIICGGGRVGELLAEELARHDDDFVVIDRDPQRLQELRSHKCLTVAGDATLEEILLQAGVQRAKSLVSALPHDAENVFITLTARNLNRDLQIIARAEQPTTYKKLLQAGANRVVMPATIGAQRMAAMISRPSTVEFLELVADRSVLDVELDEFVISPNSPLVGKTLGESGTRRQYGLLMVAVKRKVGALIFNPDSDYVFQPEDVAIVMGRTEDIQKFRQELI